MSPQAGPSTTGSTNGSRTLTTSSAQASTDATKPNDGITVLRLRGEPRKPRQRVVWDDNVIDNEGCGKKKSKICCIYHKPKAFDESSDEDSSDSDSDSSCSGHGHSSSHQHKKRKDNVHQLDLENEEDVNSYEAQPKPKRRA